jgi:hypothetical protein
VYFAVDWNIVYEIAIRDVPELAEQVKAILEDPGRSRESNRIAPGSVEAAMRSALAGDPVLANAMTSASVTLPPASGIVGLQVGSRLTQVQHPGAHLGRRQHRGSDEARNVLDLQVVMV